MSAENKSNLSDEQAAMEVINKSIENRQQKFKEGYEKLIQETGFELSPIFTVTARGIEPSFELIQILKK